MMDDYEKLHIVYLDLLEMMNLIHAGVQVVESGKIKNEEDIAILRSALRKLDKVVEESQDGKWKCLPSGF